MIYKSWSDSELAEVRRVIQAFRNPTGRLAIQSLVDRLSRSPGSVRGAIYREIANRKRLARRGHR